MGVLVVAGMSRCFVVTRDACGGILPSSPFDQVLR